MHSMSVAVPLAQRAPGLRLGRRHRPGLRRWRARYTTPPSSPVVARFASEAGKPPAPASQPPPLYVKRTLRGGQVIRHPGTVIVRAPPLAALADVVIIPSCNNTSCSFFCVYPLRAQRPYFPPPPSCAATRCHARPHPDEVRGSSPRALAGSDPHPSSVPVSSAAQVLGDVNRDSEVVAGGDVFVWGSLRGDVTAGSEGDNQAQVFSLDMRPSSVTIGGVKARGQDAFDGGAGAENASGVPEVAFVDGGAAPGSARGIVVTPATDAAAMLARAEEAREARRTSGTMARKAVGTPVRPSDDEQWKTIQ